MELASCENVRMKWSPRITPSTRMTYRRGVFMLMRGIENEMGQSEDQEDYRKSRPNSEKLQ